MHAVVSTAITGDAVQLPVVAVCFGARAEPLALADQERELRIQAEGLLMRAEMLAWQRTSDFGAHGRSHQGAIGSCVRAHGRRERSAP